MTFITHVLQKSEIARDTWAYTLATPKNFSFEAGQHTKFTLPRLVEPDDRGAVRYFSFATAPGEDSFEIAMRRTESGFKKTLTEIGTNEIIRLDEPSGSLTLHRDPSLPAAFVVGGIGITAARSIILDSLKRRTGHALTLVWSNRTPVDAPFHGELAALSAAHNNFTLVETMTDCDGSAGWSGRFGYIDESLITTSLPDHTHAVYYLSGPPKMVRAMKTLLQRSGVDDLRIKTEEYDGY